jgi:hypothetical protein
MSYTSLTAEELEDMLDRAAKRGATQALAAIGLHDDTAAKDIHEMRSLLDAWRDTRRSVWSTVIRISTASVLIFIAGAVWMNMGK